MKFIVDAQLPHGLAQLLQRFGHDAIHTTNLPAGNATQDSEINRLSVSEQRVVIFRAHPKTDVYKTNRVLGQVSRFLGQVCLFLSTKGAT